MNPPPRFIPPLGPPRRGIRQRTLAQWRGIDAPALEIAKRDSARPIAGVMNKVLVGLRIDRRQEEAEITRVWNNLLSPDVVAHAQPTGLRNGTLFVTVDSSVWLDEIVRYRRKEMLARLQHSFGRDLVTKISFRVG